MEYKQRFKDMPVDTSWTYEEDREWFIKECSDKLNKGGQIFFDWGLGDHLRYKKFKVGFYDEKEHEEAYFKGNRMYSCIWDEKFNENDNVKLFTSRIIKHGYQNLNSAVFKEVESILSISDLEEYFSDLKIDFFTLWEDNPQLYITVQGIKK